MHIAMLTVHSSPLARLGGKEAGGMNVYVRELVRELSKRNIGVDIFTRKQDSALPERVPLEPGVQLIHLAAGPAAPYDKNSILDHLPEFVGRVQSFASAQHYQYDLIHSHYWISGEVAIRLRDRWRCPVIQMFHTLGALKNRVARSEEETETSQRIAIERRLLQTADAIVAATPLDRDQMLAHYAADAGRIHIIPGGVDTAHFRPQPQADARARLGLPPQRRLLLGIGRMEPLKGLDCLIRALALLRQQPQHAALQAVLVGGEPEERAALWNSEQRRLAALRAELGVADAVYFAGAQPHSRLQDYYAAADIFVMPSHYESFGLAALEAMACGVPVVASNVGGLTFTIEDGRSGLLVPPDDAAALTARLGQVLTDDRLRAVLRAGALERAAAYSWSQVAEQLCQLYHAVMLQARSNAAQDSEQESGGQ